MLRGNRRDQLTAIGAGLVVLLTISGPVLATLDQQYKREAPRRAEAAEKQRQAMRALIDNPTDKAVAAETRERKRDQREDYDLGAQWTSAVAALVQVVISLGALAGLIATVVFAKRAWLAAKSSADADNAALKLAQLQLDEARANAIEERKRIEADSKTQEKRFEAQLAQAIATAKAARDSADATSFIGRNQSRAYVHVVGARLDYTSAKTLIGKSFKPEVFITVANVGVTPTKFVSYGTVGGVESWPAVYDGYREIGILNFYETTNLAPSDSSEIKVWVRDLEKHVAAAEAAAQAGVSMDQPRYFTVRGRLVYRDVFEREHFTDFGFSLHNPIPGKSELMEVMTDGFARYESIPDKKE